MHMEHQAEKAQLSADIDAAALQKAEEYIEQEEGASNKLKGGLAAFITLTAIVTMVAESFQPKGERVALGGLGLIGLTGAAVASVLLWGRDLTGARSRPSPTSSASGKPALHLEVGDRVSHDKYGLGLVTVVDGVGSKQTATIDFGSSGTVRLMLIGGVPMQKL